MAPPTTAIATAEWIGERSHHTHHNTLHPHGQKRRASDDLNGEQGRETQPGAASGIATHFKKLRINHAPLPSRPQGVSFRHHARADSETDIDTDPTSQNHQHRTPPPSSSHYLPSQQSPSGSDYMHIDELPHRIVITDLAAEIACIEAEEALDAATLFLPDIDKKVSAIPQKLLQNREEQSPSAMNTALVLYHDPTSLSVPEGEDAVHKAIAAARARVRERQAQQWNGEGGGDYQGVGEGDEVDVNDVVRRNAEGNVLQDSDEEYDPDAMEIE